MHALHEEYISPLLCQCVGINAAIKNFMFSSSSWKSSCTMFVLCETALSESRRTAIFWYLTLAWVLFLLCCKTCKKGEGEGRRPEMQCCMSEISLQASTPDINTDHMLWQSYPSNTLLAFHPKGHIYPQSEVKLFIRNIMTDYLLNLTMYIFIKRFFESIYGMKKSFILKGINLLSAK